MRTINFAHYREPTPKLYKKSRILKLEDNITRNNFMYVHDNIAGIFPSVISNNFVYLQNSHEYNTRKSLDYHVKLPKSNTFVYGLKFLLINCIPIRGLCKKILTQLFINSY
mgnify:CR=1 FL=1